MIEKIVKKINLAKRARVFVMGDLMVDEYINGTVSRISPEAPVPIVNIQNTARVLGGAGNVVNNLKAFGADIKVCGVIGEDRDGEWVKGYLKSIDVNSELIINDYSRTTVVKTRIIASNHQLLRIDNESIEPINKSLQELIINNTKHLLEDVDALVISDYCKGLISNRIIRQIIIMAKEKGLPILVDTKQNNLSGYKGSTIITPNIAELENIYGRPINSEHALLNAGECVLKKYSLDYLLVTRSEKGMTLFSRTSKPITVGTYAKQVFDVTGAGDTVLSAMTLGMACGLTMVECLIFATLASGIVIGKVGTATVTLKEIESAKEEPIIKYS